MKIFGLEISRAQKALNPVADWRAGWRIISESYAGAWQKNDELKRGDIASYPTLYACLNRISQDIGKLPFVLKEKHSNGIWTETERAAYSPVLRKPNGYQTPGQFREAWILSKLIDGNTFVLKQRDNRGIVVALYVLDPCRVTPLVSDGGNVFYQIAYPTAQNLLPASFGDMQFTVPASEIIHDRINPMFHQLLGVPPLVASAIAAGKNLKILRNSSTYFSNNAQPGGIVTAPAGISEEDSKKLGDFFNSNFSGENSGRIGVIGSDLKFTPFAFTSADSQLVEQMKYSDEQICQPFGIPPFKLGIGSIPAGLDVESVNQLYYSDALQGHIESMESLLDDGLGISRPLGVELDLAPLLRMDDGKKADVATKLVGGGIATPNDGRKMFDLPPLEGGDTVYMQQQDMPLDQVRKNKIQETPAQPAAPINQDDTSKEEQNAVAEEVRRLTNELWQRKALDATREALNA